MKPVFALSLSFEGIALLVRAAGGWRRVGSVSPADENLDREMARIKAEAIALELGPLRCKVVIPDDQIRYMTLETGDQSYYDRRTTARHSLEGATPYAVEDLAYDICEDGPRTHVAAVARETLAEAETFALDHGMEPMCFVASPGDVGFLGEPYFATSRHAAGILEKGEEVETDGIAVIDLGPIGGNIPPAPPPVTQDTPELAGGETSGPDTSEPDEPPPAPPLPPVSTKDETPAQEVSKAPPVADETPAEPAPQLGFVSRRKPETATQPDKVVPRPTVSGPARSLVQSLADAKAGKPRVEAPPADASERVKFPQKLGGNPPEPPRRKPGEKPALEALAARKVPPEMPAGTPPLASPATPAKTDAVTPPLDRDALAREMARKGAELTAKAAQSLAKRAAAEETPDPRAEEAERLTLFGARGAETDVAQKKNKLFALALTAILLIFVAAIAAWSALFTENGIGRFFRSEAELVPVVAEPVQPPVTATEPDAAPVPPQDTVQVAPTGAEPAAAPEQPDPEPQVAETTPAPEPDPVAEDQSAVPTEVTSDAPVEQAVQETQPAPEAPAQSAAPLEPEADAQEALVDMLRAPAPTGPLSEEEAQSRYAVTGIWPRAPEEPEVPGVIDLDDFYIASIDPAITAQDALALPVPDAEGHDAPLATQPLPPAPGTSFDLGADGRVVPSPEGTLSPEGYRVFLGRPPIVPPPTPERAEAAPPAAEPTQPDIPRIRPRLRPGDLIEETERTQLGGRTRTELAAFRPRLRPASVTAAAQAAEADDTEEDETAAAIIASLAPRPRPGNIASLIEDANPTPASLGSTAGAMVAPRATPAPAAPSSIPSTASVARQATMENAINLRKVNLIGVYGTPANRRALVRLPSGRYRKVQVGDRIDGGQVVAISDTELRYQKGGRNLTLKIPSG